MTRPLYSSIDQDSNLQVIMKSTQVLNPNEEDDVVIHDFHPRFRVYKSGRVERFREIQIVPASSDPDPNLAVLSKDVVVSSETGVSVRIFVPAEIRSSMEQKKLPLLVYTHGGAFCLQSAFSSTFHNYVASLVSEANVIAVSVDYRLAPENPIPACYEDSWAAIQWVAAHQNSNGSEKWLNDHADFNRVFLAGDSAGANITHDMLNRIGSKSNPYPLKVSGVALIHPFFGNDEPDIMWECLCSESAGIHDPRLNPAADPTRLAGIQTRKMLIYVAGADHLKERGVSYYEALKKSGWGGEVEIVETEGEGHVFHLLNQDCDNALALMKKVASFLNES